jgi:hypothetical protein
VTEEHRSLSDEEILTSGFGERGHAEVMDADEDDEDTDSDDSDSDADTDDPS